MPQTRGSGFPRLLLLRGPSRFHQVSKSRLLMLLATPPPQPSHTPYQVLVPQGKQRVMEQLIGVLSFLLLWPYQRKRMIRWFSSWPWVFSSELPLLTGKETALCASQAKTETFLGRQNKAFFTQIFVWKPDLRVIQDQRREVWASSPQGGSLRGRSMCVHACLCRGSEYRFPGWQGLCPTTPVGT